MFLFQPTLRSPVVDFIRCVQHLYNDTNVFLTDKAALLRLDSDVMDQLSMCLAQLDIELQKICQICNLPFHTSAQSMSQEEPLIPIMEHSKRSKPGRLKHVYNKLKGKSKDKNSKANIPISYNVYTWTPEDVGIWLESLSLGEYRDAFIGHEIRGTELLSLDKGDIQDLGVHKVGHLKRIQQGIKELNNRMAAFEKSS